jgi:hypothetical protein
LFAFTLLAPSILQGQWEETNGPTIEKAFSLATATTNTGDTLLYVGSFGGVIFMSTNYGDNWTQIDGGNLSIGDTGFTQTSIEMLFAHSNTTGGIDLYASCSSGIFHTADYGTNWVKVDTLIDYPDYIVSQNTHGDTILFKTDNTGCLTRSIDHGITWDKCLGLPTKSFVSLKVYDVLGKEVATLVNGMQEAGDQQVRFNTSQYPSGLYFYTLRTRNFVETKKMLLIK